MSHKKKADGQNLEALQRAVDEKRDEITGTVDKIRETVQDEVRERKQAVKDAFDWKVQYHRFPVIACAGAMAAGAIAGKLVGGKVADAMHKETLSEYATRKTREVRNSVHDMAGNLGSNHNVDPGYWKGRMDSAMSGAGKIAMQEAGKLARDLIVPTLVAAITGKVVHDNTKQQNSNDRFRNSRRHYEDEVPDGNGGKFSI